MKQAVLMFALAASAFGQRLPPFDVNGNSIPQPKTPAKTHHVHHGILEGAANDARVLGRGAVFPVRHPKRFGHGVKKVAKGAVKV